VWAVVQLLLGKAITLDSVGRPKALFNNKSVHDQCPRKGTGAAKAFGIDRRCLKELGCRGPQTIANCPLSLWNGGANWCVDANAPCIGCTNPKFPGGDPLYKIKE
jgi:hydrogenase small subunit